MNRMKAFVRIDAQSQTVQQTEVLVPSVDNNEVLVKVKAFGVGIHDRYFIPQDVSFPFVIGSEGSGVIVDTGSAVKDFAVGNNIIMSASMLPKGGCWSEYAAIPASNLVRMVDGMDYKQAAALPVAGKTAMECMNALDLHAGETLFVAGASGAIGTFIVQLAKSAGIRVIGSASTTNHAYMQSLGAELAVDYKDPMWQQKVLAFMPEGVDAALAILPGTATDCLEIVKYYGKVITVSGDSAASERGVIVKQFEHKLNFQQAVSKLVEKIDAGHVQVVIEKVYPFDGAVDALEKTETRHARGKLVVSLS